MREDIPIPKTEKLERQEGEVAQEFFDLQLKFADTVQKKSALPREEVLAQYTNLRQKFFAGLAEENQSKAVEMWNAFVAGLDTHSDQLDWTYQTYLKLRTLRDPNAYADETFGCFNFHIRQQDGDVQIHFENRDTDDTGPLSATKIEKRKEELREMFSHIKKTYPEAKRVNGESWLYNTEAYRRLFPPSYTAHTEPLAGGRFNMGRWWGQFLDSEGNLKKDLADQFLKNAEGVDMEHLAEAFPLRPLDVSAPIEDFYSFYGIA